MTRRFLLRRLATPAVLALTCRTPLTAMAQTELVIVKEATGKNPKEYHRPGCPLIRDGKGVLAMPRGEATARGYKPHRDCDPEFAEAAAPGQKPGAREAAKPAPEPVFVDSGGTYYHRKGCARLGKDAKSVANTAVGKRWPCPVCKPPTPKRASDPLVPRWRG